MRIEFEYLGKTYRTTETAECSKDELAEKIYQEFSSMKKMKLHTDDGSIIIIGETALKSGVLRISDGMEDKHG